MAAANKTILKPADLLAVGLRGTRPPQEKYMSAFFLQHKIKNGGHVSCRDVFEKLVAKPSDLNCKIVCRLVKLKIFII